MATTDLPPALGATERLCVGGLDLLEGGSCLDSHLGRSPLVQFTHRSPVTRIFSLAGTRRRRRR